MSKLSGSVLVTGANGFLGQHAVDQTLKLTNLKVKAIVRSEKSTEILRNAFPKEIQEGRLEFGFVPQIDSEGAYDEAIKGVDYVIHSASPLPGNTPSLTPEVVASQFFDPAIKGATRMLESSLKTPSVKKVVLTSSIAALIGAKMRDLDETDWNPVTYESGLQSQNPMQAYSASKALAEKAAWEFMEKNKPTFTLTSLNPTFFLGPQVLDAKISGSNQLAWNAIANENTAPFTVGAIDVRDVAKAHVLALINKEVTDGKRYVVHSENPSPSEMIEIAHRNFPEKKALFAKQVPVTPLAEDAPVCTYKKVTVERTEKELGLKFRPIEESVVEMLTSSFRFEARL